jgi:RNA polymerase sigma-54 factor
MALMDIRLDPATLPQQNQVISHRQIMAVRLLQMPGQDLAAAISRERESNPAFDVDERECCAHCGARLDNPTRPCPVCAQGASSHGESVHDALFEMGSRPAGVVPDDDSTDPLMRIAGSTGRAEGLLTVLCASINREDEIIAEYLVGSLDHHGFLPETIVEDAASVLESSEERVEAVLQVLQQMEPPGLGARGARECLFIQLKHLSRIGHSHPIAEILVRDHLPALAFRHFRDVARAIGESPRTVEMEWEFIRSSLHPYPAHGYDPDAMDVVEAAPYIRPDVVIRKKGQGFEAEVVERYRYDMQVNREYAWARKHLPQVATSDAEKQHIRTYVEQANSFIAALRQRWDTMQRVSDALIELQYDYLAHGQSALKPLTRADVAHKIGLHESTVSRATDGKFVLLPNGRTVLFDNFFDSSLPIKKALRELIASENSRRPYSDEQLARLLAKEGFTVARRTIAKYREEESILPSRLRKSGPSLKQPVAAEEPVRVAR